MPTKRMIDPAFWQSETMAELTRDQRLLFIGLFSNADDQGRMRAHGALIRSMVFPYDDIELDEIENDLQAIAAKECIHLFDVEGKRCLQIINWWKYQSPQWAYSSKIPPPEGWNDRLRYRQDNIVIVNNWPTKEQPEVLDSALPKDLGNALGEALDCGHSISSSISTRTSSSNSGTVVDAPTQDKPSKVWLTETGQPIPGECRDQLDAVTPSQYPQFREYIAEYRKRYSKAKRVKLDVVLDWLRKGGPPRNNGSGSPALAEPPLPPPIEEPEPEPDSELWAEVVADLSRSYPQFKLPLHNSRVVQHEGEVWVVEIADALSRETMNGPPKERIRQVLGAHAESNVDLRFTGRIA